jgi:hypothetical protein
MTKPNNKTPWYITKSVRFFPAFMYKAFCKLGLTFYNKMAIKQDGKAAFFADSEDYLEEDFEIPLTKEQTDTLKNGLK